MNGKLMDDKDKFECWLMEMDDALAGFLDAAPAEVRTKLDFSPDSLDVLEAWLLAKYSSTDQLRPMSEAKTVDGAARYVGEVFRKHIGGKWMIDFNDRKNVFYGLPQLTGMPGQKAQVCPLTLVTTTADRRTGKFLQTIYLNNKKRASA